MNQTPRSPCLRRGASQPNQYAGMVCSGCNAPINVGELAQSHSLGLIHAGRGCDLLLDQKVAMKAAAETAALP